MTRVAMVTGGGRGIGAAIASRFEADGWTVAVGDIAAVPGEAGGIAGGQGEAGGIVGGQGEAGGGVGHLDVADPDSVAAFIARVVDRFGRLDVVVNNAGLIRVTPFLDIDVADWRRLFSVNVEGCLNVTQAAARIMRAQPPDEQGCRGRVINIGSPAAEAPRPLLAAYGASKAAIKHLSRSASAALDAAGIWVTLVYPTNVEEGMWRSLPEDIGDATGQSRQAVVAERLATAPTGRFQTADEVAGMVAYAATAPGVNGKLLWTEAHLVDL